MAVEREKGGREGEGGERALVLGNAWSWWAALHAAPLSACCCPLPRHLTVHNTAINNSPYSL